ncbi:unnamed protein product [Pleuronectes platessa]|uniref:Uncharacterized protein n=1 Tax=Pleuronectes platessa TaxID=8262 RepID=A0A9N7U9L1_PLEPL|nr:unnamed protein product [Pleuronectes platessa]
MAPFLAHVPSSTGFWEIEAVCCHQTGGLSSETTTTTTTTTTVDPHEEEALQRVAAADLGERKWKRCQLDVGVQTDGRQASGQLAFTAFHKPFTATSSPPYPHSVTLRTGSL